MRKSLLLIGILALMLHSCSKGELYLEGGILDFVSDPAFNEFCKKFDTDGDGSLSEDEVKAVYSINLYSSGVTDVVSLEGIEYFRNLTYLNCTGNQLTSLDISQNTALTTLRCSENQLTSLDVSNNTALEVLYCYGNQLGTLDVSQNTALTTLSCSDIGLSTLDVSSNTELTRIWCNDNELTTLNLSANTALTHLYCFNNQLTTLDLSANTALTQLYCGDNLLATLNISTCTALTYLSGLNNPFTAIYVWAGFNTADPDSEFSYLEVDDKSVFTL